MMSLFRRAAFAVPFGCMTAIGTHVLRFGDSHAMGGDANDALVSAAAGGSIAIALAILHAFLTSGTTTVTGTLARTRVRALLPNGPVIFAIAAAVYYGIESLEGNGIELGLPTLILALLAMFTAFTLQRLCTLLARFVAHAIVAHVERLSARLRIAMRRGIPRPLHVDAEIVARRFGRAPPMGRLVTP
jgi:hypothetical protein